MHGRQENGLLLKKKLQTNFASKKSDEKNSHVSDIVPPQNAVHCFDLLFISSLGLQQQILFVVD